MNDVSSDFPSAARHRAMRWMFGTTLFVLAYAAFVTAPPTGTTPELRSTLRAAFELAAIVVSGMLAALGWQLRDSANGSRFVWLGAVFCGVTLIDLGCLLIASGEGGASVAGLWLLARALALVGISALVVVRPAQCSAGFAAILYLFMTAFAVACLWWGSSRLQYPLGAIGADVGIASLRSGAGYGLAVLYLLLGCLFYRRGRLDHDDGFYWIAVASWMLALSALAFVPRFQVYGAITGMGHAFQVLSCLTIYHALFVSGVHAPRKALAEERALLRVLLDSVPDPIAFRDMQGAYRGCNDAFTACFGRAERELVGLTDTQLSAQGAWAGGGSCLRGGADHDEAWVVCDDGQRRLFDTVRIPFRTQGGVLAGELGISRDITDLRWIEEQLAASERRLALALESAALGLWDWHVPSGWVSYDTQWLGMLGLAHDEVEPALSSWEALVHPDDWPAIRASLEPHLRGETPRYTCEHRLRHKDGRWVWVLAAGSVIERDGEGAPVRVVGIHQDISPRKTLEERLVQQATSDPLTGLANRRHFDAVLGNEMARVKRHVGRAAVVLLDLDHFKRVNDHWGHAAGDEVLKAFTTQIAARLRDSDVFARLGGEEFAILLPGVDLIGAFRTAERLRRLVASVPVIVADGEIPVTVSVGVATLRALDPNAAAALARADEALYRAKDGGRNRTMMEEDVANALPIIEDDTGAA